MPHIHPNVAEDDLSRFLLGYLERTHQGKVRDTYALPGHPDKMLVVASNRISIFDFNLNALVESKGRNLTQLTKFWLEQVLAGFRHHLIATRGDIYQFVPRSMKDEWQLAVHLGLGQRGMVVHKLKMVPLECVVRGYISGSGYKDYLATGEICGIMLPAGLQNTDALDKPIFTPATKSTDGHDKNVSEDEAAEIVGSKALVLALKRLSLAIYSQGHAYALARGLVLADTKFEFGFDAGGELCLGDEVLTSDSSRYWPIQGWAQAPLFGLPAGFDKEPVRQEGKKAVLPHGQVLDISKLDDPSDPTQIALVHSWQVPKEVLGSTKERYDQLIEMLNAKSRLD